MCAQIQEAILFLISEHIHIYIYYKPGLYDILSIRHVELIHRNGWPIAGTMAMTDFFKTSNPQKKQKIANAEMDSLMARLLAVSARKGQKVEAIPLDDASPPRSWAIWAPSFLPSTGAKGLTDLTSFEEEWEEGNTRVQNTLNLRTRDGKTMQVQENHYRNLYSNKEVQTMKYTGIEIPALPVPKSSVASFMLDVANNVTLSDPPGAPGYLTVLKNFYASKLNHSVGKHSDDDPQVYLHICNWHTPIFVTATHSA